MSVDSGKADLALLPAVRVLLLRAKYLFVAAMVCLGCGMTWVNGAKAAPWPGTPRQPRWHFFRRWRSVAKTDRRPGVPVRGPPIWRMTTPEALVWLALVVVMVALLV
jgi:hypothetical protein